LRERALVVAASKASTVEAIANRLAITSITFLLCHCRNDASAFLTEALFDLSMIDNILPKTSQQKAPAAKAQGCFFSSQCRPSAATSALMMSPNRCQVSPEALQLELFDRSKIGRAGLDCDARQQAVQLQASILAAAS